ncbi:hypothetical protein HS088_TW01G00161 [Tripterygium wilfordii]|uniref:Protein RDM1 n=1 Tax=Tripterygium wilfordii TaxID=458696 RepID=A0A7J7E141_TRIWF|nr:protein RDM1-like [Tripterygium wilfordii]XP_038680962.1 protein RDM1-like [Tripterygium wilfordii]XP_038681017.1 protein RDM1-like [Tripterygium wilfordii]KAF5752253.1 hypothetical protein HS088_TW01G00161 [Tripterygium wilfordii]
MERTMPWNGQVDVISTDESSSSDQGVEVNVGFGAQSASDMAIDGAPKATAYEDLLQDAVLLIKRAKMYQEYMKQLPIPMQRGSVIPFSSWVGLGKSIKQIYGQPLHYLTNILLKQWDQLRSGAEDEHKPLDIVIHPCKAEATIWLVEEIHRHTSSHDHIAKLWLSDPIHHTFIDSIFPEL